MLEERARTYVPEHPWNRTRTLLHRTADGFMQINEGLRTDRRWMCHFRAVGLLWDSGPLSQTPDPAFPGAPAAPPVPPPPPNPPQSR